LLLINYNMSNNNLIVKEFMTQQVTMIQDAEGEVYFKGHDVATILGYAKPENAIIQHVDTEDKHKLNEITTTLNWVNAKK